MTAPLSVNVQSHAEVEMNDSCNCCIPFGRKKKPRKDSHIVTTTDETYHKTITRVETEGCPEAESVKGSHKVSAGHSKSTRHPK